MKAIYIHIKNTPNVGDIACSPYHYFKFPDSTAHDIRDEYFPESDLAIIGGGAIEPYFKEPLDILPKLKAKKKVAWGIGSSRSGRKQNDPFAIQGLDLVGLREFRREGGEYVPCVSCMSDLFDKDYAIQHDVVFYKHAAKDFGESDIHGLPTLDNRASLQDAIAFMGSAETVITNSFHGTYWATLLNRKVLCLPFSSKFYGYKYLPTYTKPDRWKIDRRLATTHPEALDDCRKHNISFHEKILNLI